MILVVFWDLCQPQSIISHLWRHFENCQCLNIKVNNPWRVRFICANGNVFNYSNNWNCILLCYQAYIVSCSDWYRRKIACERYRIILKITWFLSQYMLFNAGGLRRGKINDAASVWFNINIPKMYYRLNINGKMHIIQVCMPKCFISMGFLVKIEFFCLMLFSGKWSHSVRIPFPKKLIWWQRAGSNAKIHQKYCSGEIWSSYGSVCF